MAKRTTQPELPTTRQPPRDRAPAEPSHKDAAKETLESIVIAFVLAFAFRAYVVEAFVIPTGSMAPTLLGAHARLTCPQCGYTHMADWPNTTQTDEPVALPLGYPGKVTPCPMCKYPIALPERANPSAGDRILVHKYIYSVSKPRRWDVVVFKNPQAGNPPGPTINYIKRLIGLPGEDLLVVEGNVYVRRPDAVDWHIARKTDRPEVQKAVWQPIYHSEYLPLDNGVSTLVLEDSARPNTPPRTVYRRRWAPPWETVGDVGHWTLPGEGDRPPPPESVGPDRTYYRYDSAERGRLRFNFDVMLRSIYERNPHPHEYPYNYHKAGGSHYDPIEDIRLAVTFRPQQDGLSMTLRTEARLDDASDNADPRGEVLAARITPDGVAELLRAPLDSGETDAAGRQPKYTVIDSVNVGALRANRTATMELWFVDQEASLWIDGEPVLTRRFDIKFEHILSRPALDREHTPHVEIEVQGSPVTLFNVKLDRDLYYDFRTSGSDVGNGTMEKPSNYRFDLGEAAMHLYQSKPGDERNSEYFCLGDNSPSSSDGRFWQTVDPWIERNMFAGLKHPGVVPEQLMMGRAFFVYFPAPVRYKPTSYGYIVNFGAMRFIH